MFKDILQSIVAKTDGAIGALIMGADGLEVERFLADDGRDANLDVAAAEFTSLVRNARRAGSDLALGDLSELVVSMEHLTLVMRTLNRDYFVIMALKPDGNLGRGRYELRKAQLQLAREFAV